MSVVFGIQRGGAGNVAQPDPITYNVRNAMDRYFQGYSPGGFLEAVIAGNDNFALARADEHNHAHYAAIKQYVMGRIQARR